MSQKNIKKIYYITEPIEWVISWEGKYIAENIRKLYGLDIKLLKTSRIRISLIRRHILHFGSRNTYLPANYKYVNKSNSVVLTWYHGTDDDIEYIRLLPRISEIVSFVHTSNTITRNKLIEWGADPEKIKVIPIGIELDRFSQANAGERSIIRKELGIPPDSICIGSFQKDGNGWGEGDSPKLIKGPDIFCDTVEELKKKAPVFVLLTGPARGYVKKRLEEAGIPYTHRHLKDYLDIGRYYNALDLYVISSRAEGGPKALLESFASGVPLVSTDVGMVHDLGRNGENILVSQTGDIRGLASNCLRILEDGELRKKLIKGGLETAGDYDWKKVAARYFEEIYSRLL